MLKLASGFATWKTDKISNANAPFSLSRTGERRGSLHQCQAQACRHRTGDQPRLDPPPATPNGSGHQGRELRRARGPQKKLGTLCFAVSADLEVEKLDGHAIKNLKYPNLPTADLQNATESLEENTLIAAPLEMPSKDA